MKAYNYKIVNGLYECPICLNLYKKYGIRTHIWKNHTEEGRKFKRIAWNKGLTSKTDIRVKNNVAAATISRNKKLATGWRPKYKHSNEFLIQLSERQSIHNSGGKCKWFEVNNIKVQGTWEYKLALKMNDLGIIWTKPKTNNDLFKYVSADNKIRSYAPDFYLPEYDLYLEIKGHWWGNDKQKMHEVLNCNKELNKNLKLVRKELLKKLLDSKSIEEYLCDLDRDGDIVLV